MIPGLFAGAVGQSGVDTGDIANSLRFRTTTSHLSRVMAISAERTMSFWCKRGNMATTGGAYKFIFYDSVGETFLDFGDIDGSHPYQFRALTNGGANQHTASPLYRDPTSWLHFVVSWTLTTITIWCNGVQIYTAAASGVAVSSRTMYIGYNASLSSENYYARFCLVDGDGSLTPDDFGYLNTDINEWVSKTQSEVKAVVDAGGTNSFMLDFDDATSLTTLGYDKSSKGNNWTLNNFSLTAGVTYDHMLDVPGNSYATLNPLVVTGSNPTLSEGNLKVTTASTGGGNAYGSIPIPSSGKWYYEVSCISATSTGTAFGLGVSQGVSTFFTNVSPCVAYDSNGYKNIDGAGAVAYGASFTDGDLIGNAVDADSAQVTFYKNNASQGAIAHSVVGLLPAFEDIHSGSSVFAVNFGQRPFAYTPPTGFKALCQANLENTSVTVSGTFTGNASADGPFVWMNGVPKTLTINSNAVTFGTHADKTAGGFKLRTSSASYNTAGSNTWTATIDSDLKNCFKYNNAQGNP